ncbi:MAG TPA: DNA polymerase III subunit alpha, partial [Flavobacteriales bacterium]|nr:DNA polymerase III subunit alpha [Flavobacteriales bacterium]
PDQFADLIAMNALYRPGPLEYIPTFIKRKQGLEPIVYDLPEMEELLKETYGVTVYQEQVMLLSQKLAGFSKGDADVLRKAMGKKDKEILLKMKGKFLEGTSANGFDPKVCEKIWTDWVAFAQYAFNKSHSTCYAFVAYQTTWLKANYPPEFMASVLTHTGGQIDKITFFMEECRRMGIPVLGPDVNESQLQFSVNKQGQVRFGLGAVKGVGASAVEAVVSEREAQGLYKDVFDLVRRVNLRAANRKALESLADAGAFDGLPHTHRAHFFHSPGEGKPTFMETLARYGQQSQDSADSAQVSMFGETEEGAMIPEPPIPAIEPWSALEQLHREKEVIGFYLSGHPLDDHRLTIRYLCNTRLPQLEDPASLMGRELCMAGIVTKAEHRIARSGKNFGTFTLEDQDGKHDFMLFSDDYVKFGMYLQTGILLLVKGRAEKRTWGRDEGQVEFKIASIDLLADAKEKYLTKLTVQIDAARVNAQLSQELAEIFSLNTGNCKVIVSLLDREEQFHVDVPCKTKQINMTADLASRLDALADVKWTLS